MALLPSQAALILAGYGIIYVLPLYASPATRPSPTLTRDAPRVIRARIRATSVSTTLCSLLTLSLLLGAAGSDSIMPTLHAMGYWPIGIRETGGALVWTAILFAAPLYEILFLDGVWKDWLRLEPLTSVWNDMVSWRNIVAGPVTEEVLFRSASIPVLLSAGVSIRSVIFLSPMLFGLAHVHHFYEFRITHPRVPIMLALVRSAVQFMYTSLFGTYATFVYLRTGSLLAVIAVHSFCNSIGLPRFWGQVEPYWLSLPTAAPAGGRRPWEWTIGYYVLLLLGAAAWWQNMYPLTASRHALALRDQGTL